MTLADIIDDNTAGTAMSSCANKKLKLKSIQIAGEKEEYRGSSVAKVSAGTIALNSSQPSSKPWSVEERKSFYNGLRMFGTDFGMISATILKNRTQKQIYKRFQKEDRLMPDLVTKALRWNSEHRHKLAVGFSKVLKHMNVDLNNFDPLEPNKRAPSLNQDGIAPLEYYLLNPEFN